MGKHDDIFDALDAEGEDEFERRNSATRKRAFENTQSNRGWYRDETDGTSHRRRDMEADHIYPHSEGGDNSRRNLQLTSIHNNRSKGNSMENTARDYERRQKEIDELNRKDEKWMKQNGLW